MIKIKFHPLGIYKEIYSDNAVWDKNCYINTKKCIGKKVLINDWHEGYINGVPSYVDAISFKLKTKNERGEKIEKEFDINDLEELLLKISLRNLFRKKLINSVIF